MYHVVVPNRNYQTWTSDPPLPEPFHPLTHRLFSRDVFDYDETTDRVTLAASPTRNRADLPGVLILQNNKTYGRNDKQRLLYKCVPDDVQLPAFLIPYEMKQIGFTKVFSNLYVTFSFASWRENEKHPMGCLTQVMGPVDQLSAFYEYQLVCKQLHDSIQPLTKQTSKAILQPYKAVATEDRTQWHVITIDPCDCSDYDDAFSLRDLSPAPAPAPAPLQLSVYISNVALWIDRLQLWDFLSERVATIYLPDRKRPMLPTILSEGICSLKERVPRDAIAMDLFLKTDGTLVDVQFAHCKINVTKNYVYEEAALVSDSFYQRVFSLVKTCSQIRPLGNPIQDSHDVVSYLMIWMNHLVAKELLVHKTGILRASKKKTGSDPVKTPDNLPHDVSQFFQVWKNTVGHYTRCDTETDSVRHETLELDAYTHITSPIRRLVDLLNMVQLQEIRGLAVFSEKAAAFYKRWLPRLDLINQKMRATRHVQSDAALLSLCSQDPKRLEKTYSCFLFDADTDADDWYVYSVYVPELKMVSKVKIAEPIGSEYEKKTCRLYLFHNEEKFKKKIRLQLVDSDSYI